MSEQKARVGVIGAGWWASEYHIPGLIAHPGAVAAALCDRDPDRLQAAAEAFGVALTYTDHREMLEREQLDGVIIATPHATHYVIALDCIAHGLHTLIEKPMTLHADEARHLVEMAEAKGLEIVMGYPYNLQPYAIRAREAVRAGEIGVLQYVVCSFATNVPDFFSGRMGGGHNPYPGRPIKVHGPSADYNDPRMVGGGEGQLQLTHAAGLMFFITGLRAVRVNALMAHHGLRFDLIDVMAVGFEGGALGTVGGTGNAGSNYRLELSIYGEAGCILIDTLTGTYSLREHDGTDHSLQEGTAERALYATTHHFIDVMQGCIPNGAPGEIGWRAVELLDAAYRSFDAGGEAVTIADLYGQGEDGQ